MTLATLYALGGATYIVSEEPIYQIPHQLVTFGQQELLGGWFIAPVLVALACIVVFGIFLSRSSFGLRTYAIGSNPVTAERAGIKVSRHLVWVYTLSGALAGIAGILVTSNFARASPLFGNNDELPAIAAVVIGGTSLFGGSRQPARDVVRHLPHRGVDRRAGARPGDFLLARLQRVNGLLRSSPVLRTSLTCAFFWRFPDRASRCSGKSMLEMKTTSG